MSKLVFLAIACGSIAVGAGLAAWRDEAMLTGRRAASAVLEVAPLEAAPSLPATDAVPVAELESAADTTGLLLESPTVDQLLERASSASEEPLEPADRERLATILRTDPELRRQFGE